MSGFTWTRFGRAAAALVALSAAGGCSSGEDRYAPVSGRVTLNGRPLAGAKVSFQPDVGDALRSGFGSVADTDGDGRFTLTTVGPSKDAGARVGRHRVAVSKTDIPVDPDDFGKPGAPVPKEVLPPRYNAKSELTFEVPSGGTTEANFDLVSVR